MTVHELIDLLKNADQNAHIAVIERDEIML